MTGTIDIHHLLERELAAFKGTDEAITFSSGYLANLAAIAGLLSPQDRVIMDALCHRSLVDACRLAGVQLQRFRHNDPASLREELNSGFQANRTLIVVDGVYSMDGDICRLPEVIEIRKEYGCYLMVDESHSLGVLGKTGRGTDEHFGIDPSDVDIWTGSLAKSVPSTGGYVAVTQEVAIFLQHAASPFIFSAALCPASAAAARAGLAIIQEEPERVEHLRANAQFMREGLLELGFDIGLSETPVIPVIFPDEPSAVRFAGKLREMGILVAPVMFPAVPMGAARLRLCVTAGHTRDDLQFALDAFKSLIN